MNLIVGDYIYISNYFGMKGWGSVTKMRQSSYFFNICTNFWPRSSD